MKFFSNVIFVWILIGFFLYGCGPSGNKPNVELIQDMMDQPTVKAQEADPFFTHSISSLVPPDNTQPRGGHKGYRFKNQIDQALTRLVNPLTGNMSSEVLIVGQKYYYTHCLVCHGEKGRGDGPLKLKYPLPIPSLLSEKVKLMKDAQIFHIISAGQGVMGSYATHIPEKHRWNVVNFIRKLQADEAQSR